MNDDQLLRYSRHILVDEIGIEAQQRFLDAHAIVVGAGGLGSPAAMYLAASGVGALTLVDNDTVDLTNLQRQIMHETASVGRAKVESGRDAIARLNPEVKVNALQTRIDDAWLDAHVPGATVVLDCTDNFATRHAINRACVKHGVPLVSTSATTPRPATPACFPRISRSRKWRARPWACSRPRWASSVRCRPRRRCA